jgi:hypothetical protein
VKFVLISSFFVEHNAKFFSFQGLVFIVSYFIYVIILNQDKAVRNRQIKDWKNSCVVPFPVCLFMKEVFVMYLHLCTHPIDLS